jgi:hypothetical protein
MPATFFDSRKPFLEPGIAHVDRVYRLAWRDFDENKWAALDAVYRRLPGWCGYPVVKSSGWRGWLGRMVEGPPFWFGADENAAPHLTASVEPPGLQVTGQLSASDFEKWHEQFMAAIAEFPAAEPN